MSKRSYPFYLGNVAKESQATLSVTDKYSQSEWARVALAEANDVDAAIALCVQAAEAMKRFPPYEKQRVLRHCVRAFEERSEELADVLQKEAGKPKRDARGEVARLIQTFSLAADEVTRFEGVVPVLGLGERSRGYQGQWKREPIGPCAFITPFNFPLNLIAHKVAPAIAVGCPFVLKPASFTPASALILGEVLAQSGLPPGAFSILPCSREAADRLVTDERIRFLSFTGSAAIGWQMKSRAGKKKVALELGGNAACIVDSTEDLEDTARRIAMGAFGQSGQSCISVQRVFVKSEGYADFRAKLLEVTRSLRSGDPNLEETVVGPLISEAEAVRVENWVNDAVAQGASVLIGGKRSGAFYAPTIVEHVPVHCALYGEEVFGPVMTLEPYSEFEEALQAVNQTKYGLQAGVFTRDIHKAYEAWDKLEVGGVIVGDVPTWRSDAMPYGGIKDSGFGREGVRFAMEEMSELKIMVLRTKNKP
jgi:acyl-CoA reductase-like NAD-dependent aldehyde dehydrogenase